MSYASFIASRYLRAEKGKGFFTFISAISIIGVALGSAALIIALTVLGGFEREITEKVIGFGSHIQIAGYQHQPLQNYLSTIATIEHSSPAIKAVQPYVAREALIRSSESVDGILLKGIEPLRDISGVSKYLVEGTYVITREPGALPSVVIGKKLAAKLALRVGDKAVVFGTGATPEVGPMRATQFRITGIYESGMAEYDDVFAFTSLQDAQQLFQFGTAVSGYEVLVTTLDSVDTIADRLQQELGYPHYARTLYQNYRNLFSWIELQKKPIPIVLGLIIIVATVNIIGTLLMMVLTKSREIGVLKSLGATRKGIISIFLRQGVTIGLIGTLVGNLLAFVLCYGEMKMRFLSLPSEIYFMNSVPILLRLEVFLAVSGISIALCALCALVPAWLASRIDPIRTLRFA